MRRWFWTAALALAVSCAACIEVRDILNALTAPPSATPSPTPQPPDDGSDDGTGNDNTVGPDQPDDADSNGVDDDVDSNGVDDDVNSNGSDDDVNSNGDDNVDTTGIPPLPTAAEVITTTNGLQYYDFEVGTGDLAAPDSTVRVDYTGYLQDDGTIFDEGEDVQFGLTRVIKGFQEGIAGMRVGGRRRLIIPPDLGYGENGNAGAGISGDDVLVFDVTLNEIVQTE